MLKRFFDWVYRYINRHFTSSSILITLGIVAVMIGAKYVFGVEFRKEIDLGFFTGVPLFALGLLQLYRAQRIQQASNIKDFLSEFRKDQTLYEVFFDLIYSYDNPKFDEIKKLATERVSHLKKENLGDEWDDIVKKVRPDFSFLSGLNGSRQEGRRFYWPRLFAFSPEERRLDTLFDYFNGVGFYQQEGLIDIRDITRILGDYLAVLSERKIVKEYIEYCQDPKEWKYDEIVGAPEPYPYLVILLDEFKKFNELETEKREVIRLKERIKKIEAGQKPKKEGDNS